MSRISEILRFANICFLGGRLPSGNRKKRPDANHKIFFTLTTTPDRIGKIKPTVLSLLDQTMAPDGIILNIPKVSKKGVRYEIPAFLYKIKKLRISIVDEDLGPATKLLPTLQDDTVGDNDWIIVVDDDQVYPKKLIETYVKNAQVFPEHAMTLCGWRVPPGMLHNKKRTKKGAGIKFKDPNPNVDSPTQVEIIQGASSYAVKEKFFTKEVFDYSDAPEGAFFADDIWVSGHLAKNKVPRMLILGDFAFYRMHSYSHMGTTGLRYSVNADNQNNNELYQYFEDYWQLFD